VAEPTSPMRRKWIVLAAGEGRAYPMGCLAAVLKTDGAESAGLYSISEWWLEPHTPGPGAHSYPEDDETRRHRFAAHISVWRQSPGPEQGVEPRPGRAQIDEAAYFGGIADKQNGLAFESAGGGHWALRGDGSSKRRRAS